MKRSFSFFLPSHVWIWTSSSRLEQPTWLSSENYFCTSSVFCTLRASAIRIAWISATMTIYRIDGLCTDNPCHFSLMSFPFGLSQQYYVRIEKQLTCRHLSGISWKPQWQISSLSYYIIDMASCTDLNFAFIYQWSILPDSSSSPQPLQTKRTHTKTLLSQQIFHYHFAVPLHIQLRKMSSRRVRSVIATACTQCWSWSHVMDQIRSQRWAFQRWGSYIRKFLDNLVERIWKWGIFIISKHLLATVVMYPLSHSTLHH